MRIRAETAADRIAVRRVAEDAFGATAEADLVDALRVDGDTELALLAELDGEVVGHILLSRLEAPLRALAMGPLSVVPRHQGRGIGASLVAEAIDRARGAGWEAIFLLGDPAYYARFGFSAEAAAGFASPYAGPYFLALALRPDALAGKGGAVAHAGAFSALGEPAPEPRSSASQ